MLDLFRINQYRTLAANVKILEPSDRIMTEVYKLLKNMQFHDSPCSIQAHIMKRLSNSDLEAITNCTKLLQSRAYYCKNPSQPQLLVSDYSR